MIPVAVSRGEMPAGRSLLKSLPPAHEMAMDKRGAPGLCLCVRIRLLDERPDQIEKPLRLCDSGYRP